VSVSTPTSGSAYEIEATGPAGVAEAISGLGRTEDLCFSPDGRRVAITCFHQRAIAVVDVEVSGGEASPSVVHTAITRLVAEELEQPHGVDWLDDRTLIVADRAGRIGLLAVPDPCVGEAVDVSVDLLGLDGEFAAIYGPGSVTVLRREAAAAEVLVCDNWGNCVTRTRLDRGDRWTVSASRVSLQRLLDLPDGVAASPDGAWVAVSNHNRQVVVVYESSHDPATDALDRAPVGVLRGSSYPHGLRFTRGGDLLLVADAGSPFVHVHRRGDRGWSVAGHPSAAIQVLSREEFASGNARSDEGGPKGLDLDPLERVLAVTCEGAPLRWFDWRAAQAAAPPARADLVPPEVAGLERETELKASLGQVELRLMETETREHEAQALASRMADRATEVEQHARELSEWAEREIEASRRSADEARRDLAAIEATKAWRALASLRRIYGLARKRKER
jgi:hypothetical protein